MVILIALFKERIGTSSVVAVGVIIRVQSIRSVSSSLNIKKNYHHFLA